MNKTEQLEKLLRKFRFDRPVEPGVRERISRNKKRQFTAIMKKTGGYTFSFGVVASLFFALKKLGLGVSIVKTALILAAATTAAATLIAVGVYTAATNINQPEKKDDSSIETGKPVSEQVINTDLSPIMQNDSSDAVARRIGVQFFTADAADKKMAMAVTDIVARELAATRGGEYTVNTRNGNAGKRYGMILVGSVDRHDGAYTITARVSDVRDSRVIFYASEKVLSTEDVAAACKSIARKITRSIPAGNPAAGK